MAATANAERKLHFTRTRKTRTAQMVNATEYFQGAFVFIDATNGQAAKTTNSGANTFGGVLPRHTDAITTTTSDDRVLMEFGHVEEFTLSGAAAQDVGKLVYASDDNTLTLTSTSNTLIGRIHEFIGTDTVTVELNDKV